MNSSESVAATPEAVSHNRPETTPNQGVTVSRPESDPRGELQPSGGSQPQAVAPVTTQLPPIVTDPQTSQPINSSISVPLVAADDEVIEQEWVQKAKKIVSETKDDPYAQEKEVSKLQAEYIKKRYGKEIKMVSD